MNTKLLEQSAELIRRKWPAAKPVCGLVCGSGWGQVVASFGARDVLPYKDIPAIGSPSVAGHSGQLVWGEGAGRETFIFQGRRHWYEGEGWTPIAAPLYLLKQFGAKVVVLTNAAGGIREGMSPGDLMILSDHINLMSTNPLLGAHDPFWGPRFPDLSGVYDKELRALAEKAGRKVGVNMTHGVYLAASGPTYETPAEIRAYRTLGADAVGMSTVPEAMLAHAAGLRVLGISCITNLAAGISRQNLSHEEVTATTQATMPRMQAVLAELWKELPNA